MTRAEMVTQYNYYTRKRECYIDKISMNDELKETLKNSLANCNAYMTNIGTYSDCANIFEQLSQKNKSYFNITENQKILDLLDVLGTHLESERESAQQNINYWDGQIKDYDEEQQRKEDI